MCLQDGKSVVSGSDDKTVRVWDAATGKEVQKLEGHSDYVTSVAFSPVRGVERAPGSCGRGGRGRCGTCFWWWVGARGRGLVLWRSPDACGGVCACVCVRWVMWCLCGCGLWVFVVVTQLA